MLVLAALESSSVREETGRSVGQSDESKGRRACSDDTAVTDLKFLFVTAVH